MLRTFLTGKIHRATVTGADLNYVGSITVDQRLLAAAGIWAYEQVHVVNITNGQRLITYVIPASAGSGSVVLNGAAARLAHPGDRVIILAYGQFTPLELATHRPCTVLVNEANQILEVLNATEPLGFLDETALT